MYTKWVRNCSESEREWLEYVAKVNSMNAEQIITEFLSYLDYTEVKGEEEREVKPIIISCGRVMAIEPLAHVLRHMRKLINKEGSYD